MNGDEYRPITKALARETKMSDASAARIEQELLGAMSSRSADDAAHEPIVGVPRTFMWLPPLGRGRWLAAAAVVVLIAGTIASLTLSRGLVTTAPPVKQAASATSLVFREVTPRPKPVPVETIAKTRQGRRAHRTAHGVQTTRVVSPTGFVELPWSTGLPAFESGEIVRMEVPVASLPTYGIDISSRAGSGSVDADVLIGQDGFARAIRLVANAAMSTPRSTQ